MSVIKGENAILYFKIDGFYRPVACMESWELDTDTELAETSTIQTGIYRTYRGNRNTWALSCQGVCSFDQNHSVVKMRQLQQSMSNIEIAITETDDNNISSTFSGKVLLTHVSNSASANDFDVYTLEATGTGKYTITDIPVDPNECCQDEWIYYTGNGTEGHTITIASLIGKQIAGRLYKDGIEYRPSGAEFDGKGTPVGKQFSFDDITGKIGFDENIESIAHGEPIDIPYNLCGGGTAVCDIEITNVMPSFEDDGKFHISFLPTAGGDITPPDEIKIRYSTDDGVTWIEADDITYDPDTDYTLAVINDELDGEENYLFEVTPVCNDAEGTAGTGMYAPCIPVSIAEYALPDAHIGEPYNVDIPLIGTQPFVLSGPFGPFTGWMTFSVNGDHVELRGTPDAEAANVNVGFHISNCAGLNSADYEDTIDVTNITNTDVINQRSDIDIEDVIFDGTVSTPYIDFPVTNGNTGRAAIDINISSKITVRFNAVPSSAVHLEISKNSVVQETVTISSPVSIVIISANMYTFIATDDISLRIY